MKYKSISMWFSMLLVMMVAGVTNAFGQSGPSLALDNFSIKAGETKTVAISLAGSAVYGIQADIALTEKLSLESVDKVTTNTNFKFETNVVDGKTRVALLSLKKDDAQIATGEVINLTVKAANDFTGGSITIDNIFLATDQTGTEVSPDGLAVEVSAIITPDAPVFDPAEGTYYAPQSVTITCATNGADIYYTLDGTTPSATNGTKYTEAINVTATTTINAIAVLGTESSAVVSAAYTINELKYYAVGVPGTIFGATGAEWNIDDANLLTKQNDGTYKIEYKDIAMHTGETIECKVKTNSGAWIPAQGDNKKFTAEADGTYDITIVMNAEATDITLTVTKQEPPVEYTYFIVGPEAIFGTNWGTDENNKLTLDATSGKYTWTKENVTINPAADIEYKIIRQGTDNSEVWIPAGTDNNLKCAITEAGIFTLAVSFDPEATTLEGILTATKTGDVTPPVVEYAYYIVGPEAIFGVNWATDEANLLTKDATSGKYTWTKENVTVNPAADIEYKIIRKGITDNSVTWIPGDGQDNLKCAITEAGIFTLAVSFDPEATTLEGILTATKTGDVTPPVVEYTYFIVGPEAIFGTNWGTAEANKLTKDATSGKYTWTKENVTINPAADIEYKIIRQGTDNSEVWIPAGTDNNLKCAITEAGIFTLAVSYDPEATTLEGILTATKTGEIVFPAAPVFSPAGGTYTEAQNVTITCETAGADIYYTLDGTTPTASSTKYTTAIAVSQTTTIKAIAILDGISSEAVSATYTINDTPLLEYAYYIVGPEAIFGVDWATDDANLLTKDATSGKYTWTKENVIFNPGDLEYKIVRKGITDNSVTWIPDGPENLKCAIEARGKYTLAVSFDSEATSYEGILTATLTEPLPDVYVAAGAIKIGNGAEQAGFFGTAWDASAAANEMTLSEGIYTKKFTGVEIADKTTVLAKVAVNGGWKWYPETANMEYIVNGDGTYDVTITFNTTDNTATLDVAGMTGDSNLDGQVTTADAVLAVSIALEKDEVKDATYEQKRAANINGSTDGEGNPTITVSDAVGIVNIALEKDDATGGAPLFNAGENFLTLSGTTLNLTNSTTFVGFQMDVTLTNGAVLNGVQFADRAQGLKLYYNRVGENTWRIIGFSTENNAITGNEGSLLSFDITGSKTMTITNVEFADGNATAYALGFNDGGTTGIQTIDNGQLTIDNVIYDLNGRRVQNPTKGVYVINGRKVVIK